MVLLEKIVFYCMLAIVVKCSIVEIKKNEGVVIKRFVKNVLIVCIVQITCVTSFMFKLYSFDSLMTYIALALAIMLTIVVMYRLQLPLNYWLMTNIIISVINLFICVAMMPDKFESVIDFFLIFISPMTTSICIGYFQVMIWLIFALHKWIGKGKKQEIKSPKAVRLTLGKIVVFHILLSVLLEGFFMLCNPILAMILLILTLIPTFIVRKLLDANYIFWLFSWIICDSLVFWMMKTIVSTVFATHEFMSLIFGWYIFTLAILSIYQLLLTIYFRLQDGSDEEIIDSQGGFLK